MAGDHQTLQEPDKGLFPKVSFKGLFQREALEEAGWESCIDNMVAEWSVDGLECRWQDRHMADLHADLQSNRPGLREPGTAASLEKMSGGYKVARTAYRSQARQ